MMTQMVENVRVAWDGLRANKLRSALTMLGVIIGVATVVALLAIGEGARTAITDQISSVGTNLLFVSPGAQGGGGPVRGPMGSATTLTLDDAEALADPANVPDAAAVAPVYSGRGQIIYGDVNDNVSVTGVTPTYVDVFGMDVSSGRFVDEADISRQSKVVVLGSQVALDLFGGFDPTGQKLKIAVGNAGTKQSLTIIGVLAEQGGSMLARPDDSVFVPISTAQNRLFSGRNAKGHPVVSQISVMASSEEGATAAEQEITDVLTERHGLLPDETADFDVMSQSEMLQMASDVTGIMRVFLAAIASISLLVGGIGIMNIMLVSVTERTREIGLRKAVGARRSDILAQFLLEAIVLSALGGLAGVAVGIGAARVVAATGVTRAVITPTSVALALGAALAVGLFFGIYPANSAAKLNPIEALHYE